MRAILLICLIVLINNQTNVVNKAVCLFNNPKIQEIASEIINLLSQNSYEKIIPKLIESYPILKENYKKCFYEKPTKEIKDNVVKGSWYESDWIIWE